MERVEPASWKLSQADLMRFVSVGMTAMGGLGKRYLFDDAEMDAIATGAFQYLQAEFGCHCGRSVAHDKSLERRAHSILIAS